MLGVLDANLPFGEEGQHIFWRPEIDVVGDEALTSSPFILHRVLLEAGFGDFLPS